MIPNRAPAPNNRDLTMLRYQQMPMIPQNASNATQRKIVSASPPSKSQALPKKIGRPRSAKPVVKCADPRKQAGETLSAAHAKRIEKEVAELFKHGPLTVAMIQKARKMKEYNSAGRKVFDWRTRGLIHEVDGPPVIGKNGLRCKWWGLKK